MKTSPTAPIGSRPTSDATNGAAAPEARRAATKVGRRAAVAMPTRVVDEPRRVKRFGENRIRDTLRRDRLPLRPRGPAPHALRDLAAVRAAGQRDGAARPGRPLRPPAVGAGGAT